MNRRGFLGFLGALTAGPSIAYLTKPLDLLEKITTPEPVIKTIKPTGFYDTKSLDRLMLVSEISRYHQELGAPAGVWILIDKDDYNKFRVIDKTVTITPVAWNPTAMYYGNKNCVQFYEFGTPEFENAVNMARMNAGPDSPGWGYVYGIDLAVGFEDKLVTYGCLNKSSRKLAMDIKHCVGIGPDSKSIGITCKTLEVKGFKWNAPVIYGGNVFAPTKLPLPQYDECLKT